MAVNIRTELEAELTRINTQLTFLENLENGEGNTSNFSTNSEAFSRSNIDQLITRKMVILEKLQQIDASQNSMQLIKPIGSI